MNRANALAQSYQQEGIGDLDGQTNAPLISSYNQNSANTQNQLNGVNQGYGQLQNSLQNTANGGGINVGQAQYQGAQGSAIQQAMAAARSKGGTMQGALGGASQNLGQANLQAATARGQQISSAQSGLANAYNAQGGMNMSTYQGQDSLAQQQAQLQANQNAQSAQQGLNQLGLSQAEQNAASSALQQYNQQAVSTVNADTAHTQTSDDQDATTWGTVAKIGGALIGLL